MNRRNVMPTSFLRMLEDNARAFGWRGNDYDYGMIGALDGRGHGSDRGKLPNHPTFSNESAFASQRYPGGRWGRDFMGDTFTPSMRMLRGDNSQYSEEYMNRFEPNVGLRLPAEYINTP